MAQVNPNSIFSKRPVKDLTKENIPSRDSAPARHESQTAPCGVSRSLASVSPLMPSEVAVGGGGSYKERNDPQWEQWEPPESLLRDLPRKMQAYKYIRALNRAQ